MKLMVLDGNSILNRSYYGIRPLTTKDGFYTQAIYGFLVTMARLEDEERPDAVCVAFDRREPTFRHLEYEGYKAQRKGMPEELAMQLPVMKEVLDAMNIPRYELAGYEADDLIGTISRRCEAAGWDCVAATGDKDSLQLITEHTTVKLISTRMGQTTTKRMTPESFAEEYGFEPIHIIDLKALMGDASDNIPGVPGIGEKTAMALVQKYRSIDEIYRLLPELDAKPGVIKKLTEGEESARQSYHLATILTDAPLEFTPQDNLRKAPSDALYPLLMRLEFHKLIEKMGLKPAAEPFSAAETVECTVTAEAVTSTERAEECLARLRAADHVTVLALPDLSGVIVEWEKSEKETLSAEFFFDRYSGDWNALLRALFSADIKKVSHNVKDLMHTLLENGLPAEGFVFDTALAAYLIDATAGRYDIASLFAVYFHTQLAAPAHLEPGAFDLLGDARAAETAFHIYTSAVGALYEELAPRIEERQLHALYYEVELPLCRVLAEMELAGVRVDAKALADFGAAMDAELKTLGFTGLSLPNTTASAATFQLGKGHSVWEAFCILCFRLYGREPHITAGNTVVVETLTGDDPIIISNAVNETGVLRYCSLEYITRRSSPLSTIVYRDVGGAYSQLYSNPFGNEQQVRRNRYIIPAGEYTGNPALDAYRRVMKGQLGLHSARVTVPGLHNIAPGQAIYLKSTISGNRLMAAYQVKIIYTESGCLTRLVLADPAYM